MLPPRMGNRYPSAAPYDSFKAKDGEFVIGCGELFALLCTKVIGYPELVDDELYNEPAKRLERQAELKCVIETWSVNYTIDGAVNQILTVSVPAAPIYNIKAVMENDHIANVREMFIDCDHPVAGHLLINGNPVKLMDSRRVFKH